MKIESSKSFSLTKRGNFEPQKIVMQQLERVDSITRIFKSIKEQDIDLYILKLTEKFNELVREYNFNREAFDWDEMRTNTEFLTNYPELEQQIFLYTVKTLQLPKEYESKQGEIELGYFDWIKAFRRVAYFLVRVLADIYGKEEGTAIYKQIVPIFLQEIKTKNPVEQPENPKSVKILDMHDRQVQAWKDCGLADFAFCLYDDYKVVYRFDNCLTPEALKEFNDPDLAYLSSCYTTDHPEFNRGRIIHLRRTQTVHHAEFCDEFYWNNHVYPDEEQPSLEFTKNLGKEVI